VLRVCFAVLTMLGASGCDHLLDIHHIPTGQDAAHDALGDTGLTTDVLEGEAGCADGSREGFIDRAAFPMIAGCAGAWALPGVKTVAAPACARQAGNNGANPDGAGCNVSDLCATGWDVCPGRVAVQNRIGSHSCNEVTTDAQTFFATRQSGPGGNVCSSALQDVDDVFGCGTMGMAAEPASCAPLLVDSGNDCSSLKGMPGAWSCANPDEALNITKADAVVGGGVLCCQIPST
jgi:hypothetical protein